MRTPCTICSWGIVNIVKYRQGGRAAGRVSGERKRWLGGGGVRVLSMSARRVSAIGN